MKIKKLHNKTMIAIYVLVIIVLITDYLIITAPLPATTVQSNATSTLQVEPASGNQETINPQLNIDAAELQGSN